MDIRQAYKILEVTPADDERTIKIQFRKKMRLHHPDAAREETSQQQRRAQEINEAYTLIKESKKNPVSATQTMRGKKRQEPAWQGEADDSVFTERNIYASYSIHVGNAGEMHAIARGKYLWDPESEDFKMLLRSLNHAALELMEQVERKYEIYDNSEVSEYAFPFLKEIFNCLASQFIRPLECLKKIDLPIAVDENERSIYLFHAFLGARGSTAVFKAMSELKKGDLIYPTAMKDNRLTVATKDGLELGYLSMEEDELYYIIIPLLQKHLAQVKIQVNETYINRKKRPYQAKVNVKLYLRIEKDAKDTAVGAYNLKIAHLLAEYEKGYEKEYGGEKKW